MNIYSPLLLLPPHCAGVKFHLKSGLELLPFSLNISLAPVLVPDIMCQLWDIGLTWLQIFFLPEILSVEDVFGSSSEISWGGGLGRLASWLL